MSLSVYTIKHPLVTNWTNHLVHNELTISEKFEIINKIGIALTYEATRKSIDIHQLYLKQIDNIVEVNLLPQEVNNLIFTDIFLSQILSKDLIDLIPLSHVYTIADYTINENIFIENQLLQKDKTKKNIIIIKQEIEKATIINILDQISGLHTNINKIQLCCLICRTSTLQFLGNRYPNLNIYTTQIINDNNN